MEKYNFELNSRPKTKARGRNTSKIRFLCPITKIFVLLHIRPRSGINNPWNLTKIRLNSESISKCRRRVKLLSQPAPANFLGKNPYHNLPKTPLLSSGYTIVTRRDWRRLKFSEQQCNNSTAWRRYDHVTTSISIPTVRPPRLLRRYPQDLKIHLIARNSNLTRLRFGRSSVYMRR